MRKIGITGGIGSGKSVVSKIFESIGYKVFYSDRAAKEIIHHDDEVKRELINLFGIGIFDDGALNAKKLAAIIFEDEDARHQVNALIHPKVRAAFTAFVNAHQQDDFIFNEAAILIESGGHEYLDELILVTAPEDVRIQRVMERDGVSKEAVVARMDKQWSDVDKVPYADHIIVNDGILPVLPQVEALLEKLLN